MLSGVWSWMSATKMMMMMRMMKMISLLELRLATCSLRRWRRMMEVLLLMAVLRTSRPEDSRNQSL